MIRQPTSEELKMKTTTMLTRLLIALRLKKAPEAAKSLRVTPAGPIWRPPAPPLPPATPWKGSLQAPRRTERPAPAPRRDDNYPSHTGDPWQSQGSTWPAPATVGIAAMFATGGGGTFGGAGAGGEWEPPSPCPSPSPGYDSGDSGSCGYDSGPSASE